MIKCVTGQAEGKRTQPAEGYAACVGGSLVLLVMSALLGCGTEIPLRVAPSAIAAPHVPEPGRYIAYHSFGDSITAGAGVSHPEINAYPALVASDRGLVNTNYAVFGDQACDVAPRQIFANVDNPSPVSPPLYSLLIGTNDVNVKGVGSYEVVFNMCQQAVISWLALPSDDKILADSVNVTATGGGRLDTSQHWNAWTTSSIGASVSFSITTQQSGPIYAWPLIEDNNSATYSYSMDGVIIGTGQSGTTPAISTHNGTTKSLGFLRLPAVPAGKHVVTFTQTGPGGLAIVGIGAPPITGGDTLPTVLVGSIPYQRLYAVSGACTYTDAPCLQYIQDIKSNLDLFAKDGLDVRFFDTRQYMLGNPNEMNDSLHPNALGQVELSHAVEAAF